MSQPVKLSDALVLDARQTAKTQERSIAGQVEYWAKIGQSVDQLLRGRVIEGLREAGKKESLAERIAAVDTAAGRARVAAYLATRPYPHYREAAVNREGGQPGLLIRTDADGTETVGRFVNREFVAASRKRGAVRDGHAKVAKARLAKAAR